MLRVHDADSLSVLKTISAPANVTSLAFSVDGEYLAWGGDFNRVFLASARDWGQTRHVPTRSNCACISFSNRQALIASGHRNGTIQIIDARAGRILHRRSTGAEVKSLAWSPDDRLIVSTHGDGTERVWHVQTATELGVLHRGGLLFSATRFSPDGSQLATVFCQNEISQGIVWTLAE